MYALYLAVQRHHRTQNILLLIASVWFYGYWSWWFLLLILFTCINDFTAALWIHRARSDRRRKQVLFAAIAAELAMEHDFAVYLAPAPVYQGLAEAPSFRRYHDQVQKSLAGLTGEGSRIHLLFNQPQTFAASEMQNADHLILDAANRYTRALAARIRTIEAAR